MYINGEKKVFFMSFLYLKNNGKLVRKIVENQTQYEFEKLIFKYLPYQATNTGSTQFIVTQSLKT
jgi:hypothetical protein